MPPPKTILITGCSQGGIGDALAQAFAAQGQTVIATGRNLSKLEHFKEMKNISVCDLDVLSDESIKRCVSTVSSMTDGKLDMLVNNSGGGYSMPLMDASIEEGRKLYDLNVWAVLAVTQAFVPLLLKSSHGGVIVNQTSIVSVVTMANLGIYCSSKAAAASLTDSLRFELEPFGLKVVELKTGTVRTNFFENQSNGGSVAKLPESSMYAPGREAIEKYMSGSLFHSGTMHVDAYAKKVVAKLLASNPPRRIWKGTDSTLAWFYRRFLPDDSLDFKVRNMTGLTALNAALRKQKK